MTTTPTRPIKKELEYFNLYLDAMSDAIRVDIEGPVPYERYAIPHCLILIVEYARHKNAYSQEHPLCITIRFREHAIEATCPIPPDTTLDETFDDLYKLTKLCRQHFCLPKVRLTEKECIVSIPLFI